jgi:hypothetical protein
MSDFCVDSTEKIDTCLISETAIARECFCKDIFTQQLNQMIAAGDTCKNRMFVESGTFCAICYSTVAREDVFCVFHPKAIFSQGTKGQANQSGDGGFQVQFFSHKDVENNQY